MTEINKIYKELGLSYIGSEISENQVKWAEGRLLKTYQQPSLFDCV